MKAIQVTLQAEDNIRLPLSYQHILQSLLYSCWRPMLPGLHEKGIPSGERSMKLFCFGRIEGKYRIEAPQIVFAPPVSFEVRSAQDELVEIIAFQLRNHETLELGNNPVVLDHLEMRERQLFPDTAAIQMISPVTVHETTKDGKTRYLHPEEAEWSSKLASNLQSKLKALKMDCSTDFSIKADACPIKQVARFKHTYITAYSGKFIIKTNPEAMRVLYYCGLGNRNSQGFGLFDIPDKGTR